MMNLFKNYSTKILVLAAAVALTGCETTSHQYSGPQRQETEIAVIRGVTVVEGEGRNPNIVMSPWKINGSVPKSELSMTHAWGLLPGKYEIGVTLSLGTLLPMTLSRFDGTYWVPLDAEGGYVYQFYTENNGGKAPLKVCALRVTRELGPIRLKEGMKMPDGATIVGCGTPKSAIENYSLRSCPGVGTCPISDEYIKP